jgi:hypothetical protein
MFDISRTLPLLQTLKVAESPWWQYKHTYLDHHDLQLLVQCCPGLRDLRLGAAVQDYADVSPLMQLQQLTALTVCLEVGDTAAQGLAVLTGLRRLTIHSSILPAAALAWLTNLRDLEELGIYAEFTPPGHWGFQGISPQLVSHHPDVDDSSLYLAMHAVSWQTQCVHSFVGDVLHPHMR